MRRPRFALSMMLGAMAMSLSALGIPPCANDPAAGRDTPNAALICPASTLAAESHPFRWFETVSEASRNEVIDGWVRTIQVPTSAAVSMRLETCDLSITDRASAEAATAQLALEWAGFSWIEDFGACSGFQYRAPVEPVAKTSDASALAADYRHSTGQAEALRINLREGRPKTRSHLSFPNIALFAPTRTEAATAFHGDIVLATVSYAADPYVRYYHMQQSADAAMGWVRMVTEQLTSGLSEVARLATTDDDSPRVPLHTISIVPRTADEKCDPSFELASDDGSRFVYLRATPQWDDGWILAGYSREDASPDAFELVIDGPDRFFFLRRDGNQAPAAGRIRSMAVMLPRPYPPGSALGIDADWLAWDYFTCQVKREFEIDANDTIIGDSPDPDAWDCFAWARNQDTPREQIEAEEAASDGSSDAIQGLIREQAETEGVSPSAVPSDPLEANHGLFTPPGCHGSDPAGCLSLREEMRAKRWADSAAWSLSRLAAVLEGCASRLRDAAVSVETQADPETPAEEARPAEGDSTQSSGWLEPTERTTVSQRFLSELYLGL